MKYYNQKIAKFIEWMKNSSENPGDDPIYRIPTLSLFQQYRLEADEEIPELTDEERHYLDVYSENLIFSLASKGVIRGDIGKLFLESQRGWAIRTKPQEDGPVDLVTWDFNDLLKENTVSHDNFDFENEAIEKQGSN